MSLVTASAQSLGACSSCGSRRTTAISMVLTDGTAVDFRSCHACEHKAWVQGDVELDISAVLEKAKKLPGSGPARAQRRLPVPKQEKRT